LVKIKSYEKKMAKHSVHGSKVKTFEFELLVAEDAAVAAAAVGVDEAVVKPFIDECGIDPPVVKSPAP
jgi:hypothetical protein